jgi:nitrogen fixation protein
VVFLCWIVVGIRQLINLPVLGWGSWVQSNLLEEIALPEEEWLASGKVSLPSGIKLDVEELPKHSTKLLYRWDEP